MSTFLACWRFFGLRGCGKAARESLGGNLRVEGKRRESQHRVLSSPSSLRKGIVRGKGHNHQVKGKLCYRKWELESKESDNREKSQSGSVRSGRNEPMRALPAPCTALLSLTSFRGVSPKWESVFLLGILSPWLSVLPYKSRYEDGRAVLPTIPNTG